MKTLKDLFLLMSICTMAFAFQACEKEDADDFPPKEEEQSTVIWDIYPINLIFTLTGENGEDLLNPATPGNYSGLNITATYKDKTYTKDVFEENWIPLGRANTPPIMYGIYTSLQKDGKHAIVFGDLNGGEKYENATITLNWGDSNPDIITFSSTAKSSGNELKIERTFKVNGEVVAVNTNNPVINIKKKPLQGQEYLSDLDISPLVFNIYLRDSLGRDLLDKTVSGHTDRDSVKVIFKGKEYFINQKPSDETLGENFTGLTLANFPQTINDHPLKFGELDGTKTFEDEKLVFDWGNLGKDTIVFTSKIVWEENRPIFIRNYSHIGGKAQEGITKPYFRIVK